MADTATTKLFKLEQNDFDGAVRVARAFKREGGLTAGMARALLRTQNNYRPLLRVIGELGIDE